MYIQGHLLLSLCHELLTLLKNVKYESYTSRPLKVLQVLFLIYWVDQVT